MVTFVAAADAGVSVVDFDVHFDDAVRDWRNPAVARVHTWPNTRMDARQYTPPNPQGHSDRQM